ncbi:HupE/UreJ family protein [Rhizobium puerariae]|uniref:HupE/UreJ family protein n=1 Tax=Rhizobium puerariae TaxID=1585791 RepID=A0ABV6AJW2_9HYPH
MTSKLAKLFATLLLSSMPSIAFAHTGSGDTNSFVHGFGHPISGIDHVLAMVMVGVFACHLGGRALWAVPSAFVVVMIIGGALGAMHVSVPLVETGIALSVVALGLIVALRLSMPTAVAMGIVGLFAIFHGHAHGTEMPENAGGAVCAAGFVLATALLYSIGIVIGAFVGRIGEHGRRLFLRSTGGLAAVAGIGLLVNIL